MIWKPDTCTCILEFSKNTNLKQDFTKFIQKCKLHTTYDDVIAHNRSYNLSGKSDDIIIADKQAEKDRVRKL